MYATPALYPDKEKGRETPTSLWDLGWKMLSALVLSAVLLLEYYVNVPLLPLGVAGSLETDIYKLAIWHRENEFT